MEGDMAQSTASIATRLRDITAPTPPKTGRLDPVFIALLTLIVCVAFSWLPAYWTDEVATLNASSKPWGELMGMLRNLDAVHGSYYAFMQVWTGIFGTSPFATRLPSALACALAAAAVTTLGARLAGRATGLFSGAVFACLPITTQVGQEARGTAIALAAVAWSAVFLDIAIRRGGSAWVWYSLTLTLGILFFLQSVLLIVANLVTLLWMGMRRADLKRWSMATGVCVLLVSPLIMLSTRQTGQVAWIQPPRISDVGYAILWDQWFRGDARLSLIVLILAMVPVVGRRWARLAWQRRPISLISLAMPWIVIPIVITLTTSFFLIPVYTARYMFYTTPALALLVGVCLAAFKRRWIQIVALTAVLVLSIRPAVNARTENSKLATDWSQLSDVVSSRARWGDVVVFAPDTGVNLEPRRAKDAYPTDFAEVADLGARIQWSDAGLWPHGAPIDRIVTQIPDGARVWLITSEVHYPDAQKNANDALERVGYRAVFQWRGPWDTAELFTDDGSSYR